MKIFKNPHQKINGNFPEFKGVIDVGRGREGHHVKPFSWIYQVIFKAFLCFSHVFNRPPMLIRTSMEDLGYTFSFLPRFLKHFRTSTHPQMLDFIFRAILFFVPPLLFSAQTSKTLKIECPCYTLWYTFFSPLTFYNSNGIRTKTTKKYSP